MEHVDTVMHTRELIAIRENVNNQIVVTELVNFSLMPLSKSVQNIEELQKIANYVLQIHAL